MNYVNIQGRALWREALQEDAPAEAPSVPVGFRSDALDRIRINRARAFHNFRLVKKRMRETNSWDHYEWLAQYLLIYANEHRVCTRILRKNGAN